MMDIAKLKRLSAAVIDWADCSKAWLDTSEDVAAAAVGHIDEDGNTYPVATVDCDQYYSGDSLALAHFYAAANPAAVLELVAEIERLRAIVDSVSAVNLMRLQAENERLRTELAASQAREKVRIEALTHCSTDEGPEQEWLNQAREVLALPADDTALRAALAQRERETIERCAHAAHEAWIREPDESPMVAIRALEVKP